MDAIWGGGVGGDGERGSSIAADGPARETTDVPRLFLANRWKMSRQSGSGRLNVQVSVGRVAVVVVEGFGHQSWSRDVLDPDERSVRHLPTPSDQRSTSAGVGVAGRLNEELKQQQQQQVAAGSRQGRGETATRHVRRTMEVQGRLERCVKLQRVHGGGKKDVGGWWRMFLGATQPEGTWTGASANVGAPHGAASAGN